MRFCQSQMGSFKRLSDLGVIKERSLRWGRQDNSLHAQVNNDFPHKTSRHFRENTSTTAASVTKTSFPWGMRSTVINPYSGGTHADEVD